jgi:hyaluronate lyase
MAALFYRINIRKFLCGASLLLLALPNVFAQPGDMAALRIRWRALLTGGDALRPDDPLAALYLQSVDDRASRVWSSLIKRPASGDDTRTCLFADLPITAKNSAGSSQITLTYDRLRALALAYKVKGAAFCGRADVFRELVAALDLMCARHYSAAQSGAGRGSSGAYGNWYDWRIGVPLRYNDLLMILSDDLSPDQMYRYVAPVLANNKAIDLTGANKTWIAGVVAQAGALTGDSALIANARASLRDVFPYVTSGDGYYADGSFVQHAAYAYTGGYGKALLATIAPLMYVLKGSPWEITYCDGVEQNFYRMIFEAYEPLIYGGRFMDMVREREISRIANQDHIPGRQAIRAVALLLEVLPATRKARAESMLKEWLLDEEVLRQVCSDPIEGFLEYYLPPLVIGKAQSLLRNSAVQPRGELILHKTYPSMARVVHRQRGYALGLAMTSPRIKNTEGTNNEGLRLWHIGDGVTYLYSDDKEQYAGNFWATVDLRRLPGATVTRAPRGDKDGYGTVNPNAWVGGADLDGYGAAGLQLSGFGVSADRTLLAKKSWFMFDDEVVALGSGITLETGAAPVETTVENRKLKPDLSNRITVNGKKMSAALIGRKDKFNGLHKAVQWIHLEGNRGAGADVGYYFPQRTTLHGLRETRAGAWSAVNAYFKYTDTAVKQNSFATLWLEHGNRPKNEQYAYVMLPAKSADEVKAYAENPDVEILEQSDTLHAVYEKKLNVTAINFWKAGTCGGYSVNKPASLLVRKDDDGAFHLAIADPTQSADSITLTIRHPARPPRRALTPDELARPEETCMLPICVQEAAGKSIRATFRPTRGYVFCRP